MCQVLRLYPSAPIFMREAVEDDTLPDGTKVYANTSVLMSPFIMARLPEIWEDPLKCVLLTYSSHSTQTPLVCLLLTLRPLD